MAQASRLIRKVAIYSLVSLVPDLVSAFDRCMVKPTTDPAGFAKTAIAEALCYLDDREEALFLQGQATVRNLTVHC